ncbi:hypothetical protein FQA39_LY10472 [Lamprigera yunnana]|nr:hypothetical protein FQA39_LY10472 [Lamprigera yunnana]
MSNYNPAEEARLLQYNNASNEVLVDVTRYTLDGDADKYVEMGYGTYLNLEPVIRIQDGCGDFGSGGCQALLNKNSVLLTVEEWKTFMGLESYLANQFFHDSIEIQHILEQSFKDDLSVRNISRTGRKHVRLKTLQPLVDAINTHSDIVFPQKAPRPNSHEYQYRSMVVLKRKIRQWWIFSGAGTTILLSQGHHKSGRLSPPEDLGTVYGTITIVDMQQTGFSIGQISKRIVRVTVLVQVFEEEIHNRCHGSGRHRAISVREDRHLRMSALQGRVSTTKSIGNA